MAKEDVVIRFDNVSFKYNDKKVILDEANFSVRRFAKITIMGQNGAGKSTIFKLLTGKLKPQRGDIHIDIDAKVAIAEQMVPEEKLNLAIREYFASAFETQNPKLDGDIARVLKDVDLKIDTTKKVSDLSGGQKARLLLAYAIIQDPDILLLDEPTNNLDEAGISTLINFLIFYPKTCLVISHDADFLNSFTDGVLNLDSHTHQVEQFVGNYYDVLQQIERHIEKQRLQNARIQKSIKDRYEKVNQLGGKSVKMRRLARKVRAQIEEDKEDMVEMRQEDATIPSFTIPSQHLPYPVIKINKVEHMGESGTDIVTREVNIEMRRGDRLLISGPNGIGKSTLLKSILLGKGAEIHSEVRVGYYSQDFSELDFDSSALDALKEVALELDMQKIFNTAGRFLLPGSLLQNKVRDLSEGQKGLLCYARFMLQEPGLLIMDEPTNHINFRHLPVIAEALREFKGAVILISHMPEFVEQIGGAEELVLG